MAETIGDNLQYYGYLEPITRRMNAPGAGAAVRGKEFSDMLARLDECLEYMNEHVSFLTLFGCNDKGQVRLIGSSCHNERQAHIGRGTDSF